jgi:two-component system OmpR family response regulator
MAAAEQRGLTALRRPIRPDSDVLCVDGDEHGLLDLCARLGQEGFRVRAAQTVAQALAAAEERRPDLVLMDVLLQDADGYALCAHFHGVLKVPVIIVSAQHLEEDIIRGFGHGADDYVTKPFSLPILVQRMQAVLRRVQAPIRSNATARTTYRVGAAVFNSAYNEITQQDACVRLTPTEARILQLLVSHEGQVLGAEQIMFRVQNFDVQSDVTVIKTHIRNLRLKLHHVLGETQVIHTVPGIGYSFRQPPEPIARRDPA